MKKFGKFITEKRVLVLIVAIVLLIPSFYGMAKTKINYDILSYLPERLDTVKGQKVLDKTFSSAATSMLVIDNMESKDVIKIKDKIAKVDGVEKVLGIDDVKDASIPKEILPDKIKNTVYSKNSTLVLIKFKESTASERTQEAIANIRTHLNKQCFLSGMSAIIKDTKDLSDKEAPFYVLIAVTLSVIVLMLTMESTIVPFIFIISIGFAVAYNMGTNIFLGEISYITKSLAAVLQLGVTMDYSIFLLHRYEEEKEKYEDRNKAMAEAVSNTFTAIGGSSLTTIAGFLALCAMDLTLGKDIGIVMAKGVILGVVCTVTILPAFILHFDKAIHKYTHKTILPEFNKTAKLVTKKYKVFIAIFLIAFLPAVYGERNTQVYYNLDETLPKDMQSIVALSKLKDDYNMTTTHFIIVKDTVKPYKIREMTEKIENVDGIGTVLSYDKIIGSSIPENFLPAEIKDNFKKGGYNLIIANSKYKAARAEENAQISEINKIVKNYDKEAMVAGEGPLTKDLIEIADKDFKNVSYVSILAIFAIIFFVFKSISIPVILVSAIQLAIFINMGIPCYTGTVIPFVASIVIGTIQLGATVDYAILITNRFKEELGNGYNKFDAMNRAIQGSTKSIITSSLTFFSATAGVAIVSKMQLIDSLCILMARGAIISMFVTVFILPSILLVTEPLIAKTSRGWRKANPRKETNEMSA
ncbi:MMPL family transporter [Clostridium sp. Marseille-Q2269]|uniref:efflux RND transporter permease subunit n=1 Tax=Clostridium sp. Marseille-Q2269 TaxID=2942205 RepID=UPI003365795B